MSGIGRGIGLGRGLGLGRGDGVGRGIEESRAEGPEVGGGDVPGRQVGRGLGPVEGIGRGRGRGAMAAMFGRTSTAEDQIASLVLGSPTESGRLSTSPEAIREHRPEGLPKPPLKNFEGVTARGRGMGRGLMFVEFSSPPKSPPSSPQQESPDFKDKTPSPPIPAAGAGSPLERSPPTLATGSSGSASDIQTSAAPSEAKEEIFPPVIEHRGEKGRKALYATNFINLKIEAGKGMVEYHVGFIPDIESVSFRKLAIRNLKDVIGNIRMYDGAALFLPEELPEKRTEVTIPNPANPEETVTVVIRYVKRKDIKNCVQFYNILFNRVMETLSMVQMRRNFYDIGIIQQIPQHKLEIWPGYCVTVQVQEGGLMLCLDSSHKVLRQETAYDILTHWKMSGAPDWKEKFQEAVIGEVVLTRYNNNSYKIDDILWHSNPQDTFPRRDGEISFVDYYKMQYNLHIADYDQPLLMSKVKPRRNDKNQGERTIVLIPEFCNMTGLTCEQTQNFQIMQDIAKHTRLSPQQRVNATKEWMQNLQDSREATSILRDWGLSIASVATQVEGRIMTGPSITFSDRMTLKETGADFGRESGANCYEPIGLKNWVILVSQRDADLARRMLETYKQVSSQLGIRFAPAKIITMNQTKVSDFSRQLKDITKNAEEFQFVVAIFPSQRDDVYGALKKSCLTDGPIPSQVILAKTLRNDKRLRSVMVKVALQINCKLGGAIWSLNMPMREKIMTVGIDVNHDPTKRNPSITAMVASLNNNCTRYYSRVVVQKPHQEIVDALRTTFIDALKAFHQLNGCPPDRIIVFRDGISNSQLDTSAQHEVAQFLSAIHAECSDLKHFTFVVVQKRLNERFYMVANGRNENPTPGSVIDHTVTRRHHFDFFLVSQLVRQGAVTPTHYIIIHDLGEIKPDLIQKFAYALSFMYFNWPGTIRVPSVCQYAHKLAFLIGQYVKAEPCAEMQNVLYYL